MKNVEIYTSDTCIQCVKAKEYLKNKNIEFKEYNISKDLEAKRELIRMGYMSIPVLIIDGEHVLGFDLNRIESLLQKSSIIRISIEEEMRAMLILLLFKNS